MTPVTAEQLAAVEGVRALLDAVPRSCIKDTPMIPLHVLTVDAVLATHDALVAEVDRLREALTKAADQFEFYAREHRTKAQACEFNGMSAAAESALAKALTNERFAAMCRAVVPEGSA